MAAYDIYIAGIKMPEASKVQIAYQDVDYNSGRTADGTMHRNRVGMKRKVNVTWPASTSSEVNKVLGACNGKDFFSFKYTDPMSTASDKTVTMQAYCGDRTLNVYTYNPAIVSGFDKGKGTTGSNAVFDSFTIDFIEK